LTFHVHVSDPDVELIGIVRHRNTLDCTLGDASGSVDVKLVKDHGHVLNPEETLVLVGNEETFVIVDIEGFSSLLFA
jgi:hypothetical protein